MWLTTVVVTGYSIFCFVNLTEQLHLWQILLPSVADVIATLIVFFIGCYYCQWLWLMLLPKFNGWCCCQMWLVLFATYWLLLCWLMLCWLPKIHKPGIPLRPIISSIGTVTYNKAKELARILKPLVGLSEHHIQNTFDFVQQIKEVKLNNDESLVSYDVTALFTSVPIPPVLDHRRKTKRRPRIIKKNKCEHKAYHQAVGVLFEKYIFCLSRAALWASWRCSNGDTTQPHSGKHLHGAFWNQGPWKQHHIPQAFGRGMWMTLLSSWKQHIKKSFFHHLNSIEEKIQFTAENTRADGSLPFLDTLVTVEEDGSLSTSIYRKPTHTNQYLQWDSHHSIANKYSVINSLLHRANNICSNQEQKKKKKWHTLKKH